jgi:hypothetical protein
VKFSSKLGLALAGIYLLLVAASVIWTSLSAQQSPTGLVASGMLAFYLTLPWSLLFSFVFEVVSPGLIQSYLSLLAIIFVSAAINAVFLYSLGASLVRRSARGRGGT